MSKDRRSKLEKLVAMASQTDSPHEAAVAREKLERLQRRRVSLGTLTRDQVLEQPGVPRSGKIMRVTLNDMVVTMDVEDVE